MANLLTVIHENFDTEVIDELVNASHVRIERIVSRGHVSPAEGWQDQVEDEWVLVLEGAGRIVFETGEEVLLTKGDHLNIPAHVRHRVSWTQAGCPTIWLAVFYSAGFRANSGNV